MVRFKLFIVVCVLCLSSCSKGNITDSALSIKSIYNEVDAGSSNTENEVKRDTLLWCDGDNIKWYNIKTGELVLKTNPLYMPATDYLVVFLDDKELIRFELASLTSSGYTATPCLILALPGQSSEEICYFICKGYPRWSDIIDAEREKNWKAIEPEWNIFIEQLKKEGKYRE